MKGTLIFCANLDETFFMYAFIILNVIYQISRDIIVTSRSENLGSNPVGSPRKSSKIR